MRRLLPALAILAACSGDDGGEVPSDDMTATITHFAYRFDLDSREAHADITLDIEDPGNCFGLPFRAEAPTNIELGGEPVVKFVREGDVVRFCGPKVLSNETVLSLDLTIPLGTLLSSQVGYSKTIDGSGNPFYYLVSWVGGCDRFAPCNTHPDYFATYEFTVTHPATHQVACPGTIVETSTTETTCKFDLPGGPTYSTFGVAAYPRAAWVHTDKGMWGSTRVNVYARPETLVASKIDSAHHNGFMSFMESTFGAYPYGDELRVYAAPTYWSGFEHPGSIMLDSGLGRSDGPYTNPTRHVLDHEIVHQWAGDETTLKDTYDFVWKEAMAEYLTFVYEDMTEPASARGTATYWKNASMGAGYFPYPFEYPELFDYYGDVYGPGPMILFRQIEAMSSRAQVIEALQRLLGEPRVLSIDDVFSALELTTGLTLGDYKVAWVRGEGAPIWPAAKLTLVSQTQVTVELTRGIERRCAFHIALRDEGTTNVQLVPVDTRTAVSQTLTFSAPFTVTRLELDPNKECLVFPDQSPMRRTVPHPWLSAQGLATLQDGW